jgi:BirA family biotin operon repressor/biotin-[acetyl-CoA-carboxylase] ligase
VIEGAEDLAALEVAGLNAFPGFQLRALSVTTSTQDVVRAAARSGAVEGFCCIAEAQSSGRGRQQRTWAAPPRSSLLASVLVRVQHARLAGVPIVAGLAVRAAIGAQSGIEARLKWPNDIVTAGGKLAGILCEVEPAALGDGTAVVIGMGVNLRVDSFPDGVAGLSLHQLASSPLPTPSRLLAAVLPELSSRLDVLASAGMEPLRREWMQHAAGVGESVIATSPAGRISGVSEGIDEDGALLVRVGPRLVRVLAGDVHIVRER